MTENSKLTLQEGRSQDEIQSIQDVLDRLKRTTYSLNELQVRPPPEGVDPTRLESYLTQEDFQVRQSYPTFYVTLPQCSTGPSIHIFSFSPFFSLPPLHTQITGNNGHDQTRVLRFTRLEAEPTTERDGPFLKWNGQQLCVYTNFIRTITTTTLTN